MILSNMTRNYPIRKQELDKMYDYFIENNIMVN